MNIPTWLQSSADPTKISLTIESAGQTLVGIVALFATLKGLDATAATTQFTSIVQYAATTVASLFTAYSTIMTFYGAVRKFFMWFVTKPAVTPPAGS